MNKTEPDIRKLTQLEKIQLVELSKTREKILLEISKHPSSQVRNVDSVGKSIESLSKTLSPINFKKPFSGKATRSRRSQQNDAIFSRSTNFNEQLRTGLDMMPIMSTTGEAAMDGGVSGNRKGKMRLPIFKLPSIDPKLLMQEIRRPQTTTSNKVSVGSGPSFQSYVDRKSFRRAVHTMLGSLSAKESVLVQQYLRITESDLRAVAAELDRDNLVAEQSTSSQGDRAAFEYRRGRQGAVFTATDFFAVDPATSVFVRAKLQVDAQRRRNGDEHGEVGTRVGTALSGLTNLGLSAEFQQFLTAGAGEELSCRRTSSSAGNCADRIHSDGHMRKTTSMFAMRCPPPYSGSGARRSLTAADQQSGLLRVEEGERFAGTSSMFPPVDCPPNSGYATQSPALLSGSANLRSESRTFKKKTGQVIVQRSGIRANGARGSREDSSTESLTRALIESLRSMEKHSKMIKKGIETAQDLISIQQAPKAKTLVFTVAAERMQPALYRLVTIDLRRGLLAWKHAVQQIRRQASVASLLRYLVVRNCVVGINSLVHKVLKCNLDIWRQCAVRETQRIERERYMRAIVLIQTMMRRHIAAKKIAGMKQRRKYQRLYDATVKIQALLRGTGMRWRYLRSRTASVKTRAALVVQCAMRGYLARKRVFAARIRRNRMVSANNIQRLARGRASRKRVRIMRHVRKMNLAAVQVQRVMRGFLDRRNISTILVNKARFKYAVRVQSIMRGALVRMNRERRVAELQEYKYLRRKAATSMQAAYRGYRSRLLVRMKLFKLRKVRAEQARAATVVITMVRGFLCRAYLRDLRKERFELWVKNSRTWQEMWSDEAGTYFYLNVITGDALWEPSSDGYVKYDGSLVLANGEVIEDPRNKKTASGQDDEAEGVARAPDKKMLGKLCSECQDRIAIRACNECGDKFCTKCFKSTHATGSRRNHTFSATGPLDCAECELVLAERWCVSCDEPYCDGCWRKVHSRGKRRFHPYSEVSPAGRVDARIYTMDGEQLQDYDSAYPQQQLDQAADDQAQQQQLTEHGEFREYGSSEHEEGEGGGETEEWTEYADGDGYPYWYNNYTGESSYDSPF